MFTFINLSEEPACSNWHSCITKANNTVTKQCQFFAPLIIKFNKRIIFLGKTKKYSLFSMDRRILQPASRSWKSDTVNLFEMVLSVKCSLELLHVIVLQGNLFKKENEIRIQNSHKKGFCWNWRTTIVHAVASLTTRAKQECTLIILLITLWAGRFEGFMLNDKIEGRLLRGREG